MSKKPIFCVDVRIAANSVPHYKAYSDPIGHDLNESHSYYTLLLVYRGDGVPLCSLLSGKKGNKMTNEK